MQQYQLTRIWDLLPRAYLHKADQAKRIQINSINQVGVICRSSLVFFIIISVFFPIDTVAEGVSDSEQQFGISTELSVAERQWLKTRPVVRVGVDADYAPYSYTDANGQYIGVALDFMALIEERFGIHFDIVPGLTWPQIVEKTKNKQLDLIATAVKTQERQGFLNFTEIYIPTPLVIMTRKDDDRIKSAEDLTSSRVALVKEYSTSKRIQQEHPDILPIMVDTALDGLSAVSDGRADAYIGVIGVNTFLASKYGIGNLKVTAGYEMRSNGQRFAIRKDWPILADIMQKALNGISEQQRNLIYQQWLPIQVPMQADPKYMSKLKLSEQERVWLKMHQNIRLGVDPKWPPFEFLDNDQHYHGMAADYMGLVMKQLGINMTPVTGLTWEGVLQAVKKKDLDILPAVMKSDAREEYLNFTEPYLDYPMVIVTRPDAGLLGGLADLIGKPVAVVRGYVTEDILRGNHANLDLHTVDSVDSGLLLLLTGEVEAYVGNMAAISYSVNKLGLTDLKIAGTTRYSYPLSIGVRKDWPELVGILNKVLENIADEDSNDIRTQWTSVRFERGVNIKSIIYWSIVIAVAVVFVFLIVLLWNRKLSTEISKRKRVEKELLTAKEFAEQQSVELGKAKTFLQMVLDNSPAAIIIASAPHGKIQYINHAAWIFVDVENDEGVHSSMQDYIKLWRGHYPDGSIYQGRELPLARALHRGEIVKGEEMLIKLQNGNVKWASASAAPIYDENTSEIISAIIVFIDISKQKQIESELFLANKATAKANEQLKELDRLKSMFIASVSHELRTPLNSIIGFTGMMLNESFGELNSKYRDYVGRVNNSGQHLLSLIKDIIDISKIESGRIETITSTFSLNDLVQEAVNSIKPAADKKDMQIETNLKGSLYIQSDRVRLLQCVLNFLSNAVKYSEKGTIVVSIFENEDWVKIDVQDTGVGIEKKDLPRLFSAFERMDTHLKVKAGGTGLGLYLTKKIVTDLLHGHVGVESTPGVGSHFWINIPHSTSSAQVRVSGI